MKESNVVLCAPARTAIGTYGGTLKDTLAPQLGATTVAESLRRSGLTAGDVHRGVVTLCIGGGQGVALALERLA